MRDMPLPFGLEGQGVFDLASSISTTNGILNTCNNSSNYWSEQGCFFVGDEPTSVLDTRRSPSPSTSASTLPSSLGGGGGAGGGGITDDSGVAAVSGNPSEKWHRSQQHHHNQKETTTITTSSGGKDIEASRGSSGGVMAKKDEWDLEFHQLPTAPEIGASGGAEKCGLGGDMDGWESVLSESASSPSQEQSILRLMIGDMEDPSVGLKELLQDFEFNGSLGVLDQRFGLDPVGVAAASAGGNCNSLFSSSTASSHLISSAPNLPTNSIFDAPHVGNLLPISLFHETSSQMQHPPQNPNNLQLFDYTDEKPHVFNQQLLMNHPRAENMQNPSFFLPLPCNQQEQHLASPSCPKRHHPGTVEPYRQPLGWSPPQIHALPYPQQRPTMANKPKMAGEDVMQQQAVINQLYKAAELVEAGNSVLAHGILARLNQQLAPIGKPFLRAAFYVKEALHLLLMNNPLNATSSARTLVGSPPSSSPFNLFLKIGAYKSFSEILPLVQFANFTCNQALLEALEGFDRIHIVDFDIGYGGQWSSFMQELALRKGGAPSLKITAMASPATREQLEVLLTRENLSHFAREINVALEFEIVSLDYLKSASWSLPLHLTEGEAIAVNLPVGSLCSYPISPSLILRFVKHLSPKIVVSVDRGCDMTYLPFPQHILQAFQSYLTLLELLDAANSNLDVLQKIERFLVQPDIEKIISGRHGSTEKMQPWRTMFQSSGFVPVSFSNFAECQAEWLLKRTPARGFHFEKRQSSLVLYWQRKELVSASAWRC
ncbi:hypothetical protein Nepgr_002448 [Nepenthes gracilis]|uniref:Scarecrow-like protein 6 n=1 Tax=Nepenthes gracilis TaxID=150966 RepID=A0AAD3P9N5_NEPGR|nr:hypothetical protein Nepgr_002448 [Nepenthes gracilis]